MKSIYTVCWGLFGYLAVCFSLNVVWAADTNDVIFITPSSTNTPHAMRRLIVSGPNEQREITTVIGHVAYGMDQSNIVILQEPLNNMKRGVRLVVVDRHTLAVTTDKNIEGFALVKTMSPTANSLVVESKHTSVYCVKDDKHGLGIVKLNWVTGGVSELGGVTSEESRGLSSKLTACPNGFAAVCNRLGKNSIVIVYDTDAERIQLKLTSPIKGSFMLYSVPDFGLVLYFNNTHYRLTDSSFSTALSEAPKFSSEGISGNIFVRSSAGKPFLIWGEKSVGDTQNSELIDAAVFFDPESNAILSHKILDGKVWSTFMPNKAGDKVYFIEPKSGEILCFDRESGNVSFFVKTGASGFARWNGSDILDAN